MMIGTSYILYREKSCKLIFFKSSHDFVVICIVVFGFQYIFKAPLSFFLKVFLDMFLKLFISICANMRERIFLYVKSRACRIVM